MTKARLMSTPWAMTILFHLCRSPDIADVSAPPLALAADDDDDVDELLAAAAIKGFNELPPCALVRSNVKLS